MPHHTRLLGLLVAALTIAPVASAVAAPATIDLRVEGRTATLFEGKVTTDVRTFKFTDDPATHTCDGTGANGGTSPVPAPTAGGALATAAETAPFTTSGKWFESFGGASFSKVAGEDTAYDEVTTNFLAEFYNGAASQVGACGQAVKTGDSYVFGYGQASDVLLALSGPAQAQPGASVVVKAVNAADGTPVAGASVGGKLTAADGTAALTAPAQPGVAAFKATKSGAIRSNRVDVCVSPGTDVVCAAAKAVDRIAARAKVTSVVNGRRYGRASAPRVLRGTVAANVSGLKDVRVRLARVSGPCARYDGARERLVATKRCGISRAASFSVGTGSSFSYLLPSRLPKGRYLVDVTVVDRAGNRTSSYQRAKNRVAFVVTG